ncbi:MAG: RHS repeat-associated core domain-containing protein [Nitrospiraceae bacterium]
MVNALAGCLRVRRLRWLTIGLWVFGVVFSTPFALLAQTSSSSGLVPSLRSSQPDLPPAQGSVTVTATPGQPVGAPGRPVSGRILSAADATPLAGVLVTLAGQRATTDAAGRFVFPQPPSGYQLINIDHASLDQFRKPLKNGTPGGMMHADPVLVNVSMEKALDLADPIWVVQTHPTLYTISPGAKSEVRPSHVPGLTLSIPDGTVIRGTDGHPNTQVAITPIPPDRVPRIPANAAPRTVYLVSFEKQGGGVPTKPVPMTAPNEAGADPGTRMQFWYYDKSPSADPASHQWKLAGYGTVSPDGRTIIPDPGVGQPQFCYAYWTAEQVDIAKLCPSDGQACSAADPVDVTTGAFTLQKTDLLLPGVLPVHITRTYRSLAAGIGPFGEGGSFNYHIQLAVVGTALRLQMPDFSRYLFSQEADGKYRNTAFPLFKGAAITKFGDGTAELRWKDGMIYAFNSAGWLVEQRDRYNNKIQIIRDVSQRVTEVREPSGRKLTFIYTQIKRGFSLFDVISSITDPMGRTVSYVYYVGSNGRLSRVSDPARGWTTYSYGEYAQTYYWNEGMLSITDARGITYLRNEYDINGRVAKQILADGGTYTFAYTLAGTTVTQTNVTDPRGNVTIYRMNGSQYMTQVERPGSNITNYERETGTNKLTAVVDPLSRRTEFTYDSNGNVLTIKDPENNTTTFTYESTYNRLATITDAMTLANVTTFAYNDTARTTTITDPESKQTVIQYSTTGQPTSITDPLSHVTSFAYDSAGNLTSTTDALSNVTTRSYDAVSRLILLTDPRGMQTRFSYDDLNRVTQIQDALGGLTSFSYDNNGNLLTVTDAKNQTTTYTYDEMDRLKTRKDALNRTESYQYDPNGNLSKFTDRKSQVATFAYDALNRRTGATYPDSSVTFGYDAIGRLTSVSDSVGGNITWTYDTVSSGHHPRVQETTTPGTVTVEYDEIGRRLKLSATGQTDVTYTYDKNSRLKTVTQGTQTVTLAYDDAGRRTSLTYPNGVVTSYGYDNANRLLTMDHVKTPTTIEALTYQNDAAGNRTKLTRANAAATLIPQAVTNTAFDATNEQTRFNSASTNLVYDNNGNLTSFTDASGTTTYTWNSRNQLTAMSGPSLSASFVYDGLGRRTSKTINSATIGFWYDEDDVLAELSGSTPTATYIRSLSIDEPFIRKQSSGDEYYDTDALGSTLVLTDAGGSPNTTYTQEPFAKTTKAGTSTNSFQFTGRENDATGLYYYRARYYSPVMSRFLSEDPIEFAGGDTNLYAYVFDNPANYTDPSGEIIPLLLMCARGGLSSIGMDMLAGRKIDWVGAGIDCLTGGFGKVRNIVKVANISKAANVPLWSSTKTRSSVENAFKHWKDHRTEFPEFQNSKQYVEGAKRFFSDPPTGTFTHTRPNGDKLFYNAVSNTFGVQGANGAPRTMFRPRDGLDYWLGQIK